MGNILIKCRSPNSKNSSKGDETEDMQEGAMIENNRDNYFTKEDLEEIKHKFPEYKEWLGQDSTKLARSRIRQKKIKWKEGEAIGNGSFGRVIMGLNLQKGYIMAVKQVQIGTANTQAQQERIKALEIEIDFLSQLDHKNIVRYYGSDKTKTTFNIFLEFVSGGTIASLIEKYGPLSENLVRVYTKQILEGLEYLHLQNTVHRDIKGANVLVNNSGICKLADFGTAKRISSIADNERFMPSIRGTVNWMAPEVIKQASLGRSSDIWSVGCTVLEMLTGKVPWAHLMKAGSTQISALYQIASAKTHPPLPDNLSPEATDFLKQCFKINPADRANVIQLLRHKFIVGNEAQAKTQTPSSKSKKGIFGSTKSTEMIEKDKEKEKEKEKEKDKANSKNKPSFMKYINTGKSDEEVETISSSTLAEKKTKEKKETREHTSLEGKQLGGESHNGQTLTKINEEEKQADISKKPRYTIKSDHYNNSANLDMTNEKPFKELRAVSCPPVEEVVRYKKNSMDESNHYQKESPRHEQKALEGERGIETEPSPTYKEDGEEMNHEVKAVLTQKSPKTRPLGRNEIKSRRNSVLEDHEKSSANTSIASRKNSDAAEPNPQGPRRQNGREGKHKDVLADENYVIIEEVEKEENKSPAKKLTINVYGYDNDKNPKNEAQSPGDSQKESRLSDSDCELSQQYDYHNRVSASIQTVYVPDGHMRTGESSVFPKRQNTFKNSVSRRGYGIPKEGTGGKSIAEMMPGIAEKISKKPDFHGIKLTESIVVPKKGETKENLNKDHSGTHLLNTAYYMPRKSPVSGKQQRSQHLESLTLGESVNPPDNFGKHVMNNLIKNDTEGEIGASINRQLM